MITDYKVEYKQSNNSSWSVFADGVSNTTTASVTGLINGTSYDFRVSAINNIGASSISNISTALPGPRQYYVDSINGSDSNNGRSILTPWKTLYNVNVNTFYPGETINFKRGGSWDGLLGVSSSGTEGNPITYKAYGTGPAPHLTYVNGGQFQNGFDVYGDWIVIQDFLISDVAQFGVWFRNGADHNIAQDLECTRVGTCIASSGQYNLMTRNYAHDLKMVVNDVGGDNDFGANGYAFYNSHNELSYSRCINCVAPSYDYGVDGGFIEMYGAQSDNSVHHNYAENTNGFFEAGGSSGGTISNIDIYSNVINNPLEAAACIHSSSDNAFTITPQNIIINNNTIIINTIYAPYKRVIACMDDLTGGVTIRNNIIKSNIQITSASVSHDHNIFFMTGNTTPGITLGIGDMTVDPLFVNFANNDFHLSANSPAINAGASVSNTNDYEGHTFVGAPDIGAYEYISSIIPNLPPTANAGADQSITLPTSSVTLSGSGTDPDGTISSYSWTKVSGAGATIVSPNSTSTTVTGLSAGTYIFWLTVTDNNGATNADAVTVIVNPQASGGGGSGGGGGGGGTSSGGGGTTNPPIITPPPIISPSQGCLPGYNFNIITGARCTATTSDQTVTPISKSTAIIKVKTLNVRNNPSTSNSEVVTKVSEGQSVTVLETDGLWSQIKISNGQTGWVFNPYIEISSGPLESTSTSPSSTSLNAVVTTTTLNVRDQAVNGLIISTVRKGDIVSVLSTTGKWSQVQLQDKTIGWLHNGYINIISNQDSNRAYVTASVLNVRTYPISGSVIGKVTRGTVGNIIEANGNWKKMEFGSNLIGWVSADYIK